MTAFRLLFLATVIVGWLGAGGAKAWAQAGHILTLDRGWSIRSAAKADPSFADWRPATVPGTVLGALVNDGVYTNIFFGTNLANIPRQPFASAWWFRDDFVVSRKDTAEDADLIFDGINYRADIWLNGKCLGTTNRIFGAYRIFTLDVSGKLKTGTNTLAVEVFPPRPGDFTMGFVDWNPWPPDRGMGLFRPVQLHFYNDVALANVFVETDLPWLDAPKPDGRRVSGGRNRAPIPPRFAPAALTVCADLKNHLKRTVKATVSGRIGGVKFSKDFVVQPGQTRRIEFTPEQNPQLNLEHAQLWWPWELGNPHLYDLKLRASLGGRTTDVATGRFGIRQVKDYLTPEGYRGYIINGEKVLIRGGGWTDELLLRENETNLEAQIRYARAMNLNTIRLEGIWGSSQRLYNLADQYGMLIMAGWSCQWEWTGQLGKHCDKFGGVKSESDMELATDYLRDQVLWLRNHPSIFVWVLGSDKLPRPELERRYDRLLAEIDPTRPTLKTCGDGVSAVSGPSGVKMNGPYDYVTPNYWYMDRTHGGAFGFNTETGPGPLPPPLESLERMIPKRDLWPMDNAWKFHCARGRFHQMDDYWDAFTNRYGIPRGAAEFAFKSQAANYEAIRPMFEAFSVNLPHTTGVIQWMLNAAWPKLYWQLYDYYLVPGGAFFGTKKGAAPFSVIYDYGDHSVYLVNQTRLDFGPCRTAIKAYDANSKLIFQASITRSTERYGAQKVCDLSALAPATPVYFLDLHTMDSDGVQRADNFYWLSTKPDVLDEANSTGLVTPNKSWADFQTLDCLPTATVHYHVSYTNTKRGMEAHIHLQNSGDHLAFFIEMNLVDQRSKQTIVPVIWNDNYISLPPHASGSYIADFPGGKTPELRLRGWNVDFAAKRDW